MSDGAGAVLLMKRRTALEKNLPILGVFRCIFDANLRGFYVLPYNISQAAFLVLVYAEILSFS